MFSREYIFKRSVFHCHVSLPEGKYYAEEVIEHPENMTGRLGNMTSERLFFLLDSFKRWVFNDFLDFFA